MRQWLRFALVRAAFAVLTACLSGLLLATAAAGATPLSYGNLSYSYDLEVDGAQPTGVHEALSGQGLSRASGITGEPSGSGHLYDNSAPFVAPNSADDFANWGGESIDDRARMVDQPLRPPGYGAATTPQKLDHIFVPKHNLDPLVTQFGSRQAVVEQMLIAIRGKTPASGI